MPSIRLGNVVASLSHAMDLTEGQASGHSVRSCAIGMELAEAVGLNGEERSDLYYALLLKDAGCSANAAPLTEAFGSDDRAVKRDLKTTNWSKTAAAAAYLGRNAGLGRGLRAKARHFLGLVRGGGPLARDFTRIRCERGADIARDLGFSPATAEAIRALDEHWDGGGHPYGVTGTEIPVAARIACLAQTVEVFYYHSGLEAALEMVRQRRGSWFEPDLADAVLGWADRAEWWSRLGGLRHGVDIQDREPMDRVRTIGEDGLNRLAEAFADVIDAKSPYTSDHSRRVARVAADMGRRLHVDDAVQARLHRAGLLHDIGKLGLSNRILDKPGRLTDSEMSAVRRHPAHSFDILGPIEAFRDVLEPACYHHERLDGSGYPWGLSGDGLSLEARIVAVADVFEALSATRPYREALGPHEVRAIMQRDAGTALDGALLDALFSGGGEILSPAPTPVLAVAGSG